jgi:hypothetical protein
MGVTTRYLGHVDIEPPLNQDEYDYLRAFSRSRRSYRDRGPYEVFPRDPHDEVPGLHGDAATERSNLIADGQPGYWCQWMPCPTGCCLSWDGHEKFYAGPAWLQYLIDHFLRPGAHAQASTDPWFRRFTFGHDTNGALVGEQGDNRELVLIRVEHGDVSREVLHRGDPMPWDTASADSDRPWLAAETWPTWSNSLDDPAKAVVPTSLPAVRKKRGARRQP